LIELRSTLKNETDKRSRLESISRFMKNIRGFTLIEVISILVIVAIIGLVVAGSFVGTDEMQVSAQREVLKSHIRYAQSRAMHSNRYWGIQFSGSTYSLFVYDTEAGALVTPAPAFPNYESSAVAMPTGMTATGVVAFDFFGRPYYAANLSSPGTLTQTRYTGQISLTGVTITPDTGFVP